MSMHKEEIEKRQRFEFGKNWKNFLTTLNDERIQIARQSVMDMLDVDNLENKTVLDIGSGSGLFSLVARQMGATVTSFDYDPDSVACAKELRARFFPDDPQWTIMEGSVLEESFIQSLGSHDVVISWGVLHHTGDQWKAIGHAASLVKDNGLLFIAIYNDQGILSRFWWKVKKIYCSGFFGKALISSIFVPYFFCRAVLASIVKRENVFSAYKKNRGMSITHDWYDWLGGFPFEVASVEAIFAFLQKRGFTLKKIKTTNGLGNNEFVFQKQ